MTRKKVLCVVSLAVLFWLLPASSQSQNRPQLWEQVKIFSIASSDAASAAEQLTAQINKWFEENKGIRVYRREMQVRTILPGSEGQEYVHLITVIIHFWYLHS